MSSPADFKSDIGIKISKPHYDISSCADKDLIFSSSWPSLQVVYDGIATGNTITHGLGFPPLAFTYNKDATGSNPVRKVAVVTSTVVRTTTGLRTVIFNFDISKSRDYGTFRTTTKLVDYDHDFGIKIVKEGKDINSTDMRDFILHSRCQSPLMSRVMGHELSVQDPAGPQYRRIKYTYTDNTPPMAYGFESDTSGNWIPLPYGNVQSFEGVYVDIATKTVSAAYIIGASSGMGGGATVNGGSLVATRDPVFPPTRRMATY